MQGPGSLREQKIGILGHEQEAGVAYRPFGGGRELLGVVGSNFWVLPRRLVQVLRTH